MKKLFAIFAAVLFSASLFAGNKIYCKVTQPWWASGAAVGVYAWGDAAPGMEWPGVRMEAVAGDEGVWSIELDAAYTSCVFTRMNPNNCAESDMDCSLYWGAKTDDLTIPTDGKNLFTITTEAETWDPAKVAGDWSVYGDPVPPVAPAKFYITGDSALVTDAGAPGKAWNPAAIKSETDTFVLNLKANQYYILKVTLNGTWNGENNVKGYNELTEKENLVDEGKDHNIGFTLKEAGEVKVIYIAGETPVFKVLGNFVPVAGTPDGYYLVGSMTDWKVVAEAKYTFAATATEGEYALAITLTEGQGIKVVGINGGEQKWYPEGMGTEYVVDAAHSGQKTIYFRPAGNEEWKSLTETGFIWIDANATAIDNTEAEVKVVKFFENGQLIIEKNGVRYNAQGVVVK